MNETSQEADRKLVGVLGQFETPDALLQAASEARLAGIRRMDAYTPFPIHGLERAMGVPRTILPFIVLAVGLGACGLGLGLQWYTNATEQLGPIWSGYPFRISGKPFFSLPANIPVTFEVIVLSSAFAAFFGMLILNRLPMLANPLHRIPRFRRATNDRFFLMLEAGEDGFEAASARNRLTQWGATEIEEVWRDETDHDLPAFFKTLGVLALVLLMVPPMLVFRARGMTSREPRLHFNPDMDFQVRYDPQTVGPIAADDSDEFLLAHERAAMAPVPGTVSRSDTLADDEFLRGIQQEWLDQQTRAGTPAFLASLQQEEPGSGEPGGTGAEPQEDTPTEAPPEPDWLQEFPSQVEISEATLERGHKLFNIYCVVCHGYAGDGNGLANERAMALTVQGNASWTTAKSFFDPEVIDQPVGRIFDTITHGRSTMGPYGSRIAPEDRWAIVLYVKALQETRRDAPQPDPNAAATGNSAN